MTQDIKTGRTQVHRFHDMTALYLGLLPNASQGRKQGQGLTVYMTAKEALELAGALIHAAQDVSHRDFRESIAGTYEAALAGDMRP